MHNPQDLMKVINACLAGQEKAWAEFYAHFGRVAQGLLCRQGEFSNAELQDLVQEIMLRMYRGGLAQFKGATVYEFLAYFKKMVLNTARTYWQQNRTRKASLRKLEEQTNLNTPPTHGFPEQLEIWGSIRSLLLSLPQQDREIILLKLQGLKNREISQQLGIPQGTMESRFFRTLERLRRQLIEPGELPR